jgi:hypothetical protein
VLTRLALLLTVLLAGCSSTARTPKGSLGISWSENINYGMPIWLRHAESELGRPVIALFCHGGPDANGEWYLWPDAPRKPMPVEHAAWVLASFAEGREVIIFSCNRNGTELGVPKVWYSRQIVSANRIFYPGWAVHFRQFVRE